MWRICFAFFASASKSSRATGSVEVHGANSIAISLPDSNSSPRYMMAVGVRCNSAGSRFQPSESRYRAEFCFPCEGAIWFVGP